MDGKDSVCVGGVGVGRGGASKEGRSQLMTGLIKRPLDFILRSMASHLRI